MCVADLSTLILLSLSLHRGSGNRVVNTWRCAGLPVNPVSMPKSL